MNSETLVDSAGDRREDVGVTTVRRAQIGLMLGGLNYREPFVGDVLRRAEAFREGGFVGERLRMTIAAEVRFWWRFLQWRMPQYDEMRSATTGVRRGYVFVH